MKKEQSSVFLKKERGKTDESLTTERGKTDESLFDRRKLAENNTDEKMKSDRLGADQSIAQSRVDVDEALVREAGSQKNRTEREQAVDGRLQEQRQLVDEAVEKERASMDVALQREREAKDAVLEKILGREREQTDGNLNQEREKTDSEVKRTSKLLRDEVSSHSATKAALTTRDEFLAIVSHDLRNPIGAVLSCAELLLEDSCYAGMSDEARDSLDCIRRSAESSLRLISDILDMERVAEGKLELRVERQDVVEIIREVVESFARLASAKKLSLRALRTDSRISAVCDRDRVAQVLSNLVGNAIKFTPEGGSILVSVGHTAGELQISVSDTGPGISPEQSKRIFERYAQLDNKDRRGLGLGLYISKMFVEAHFGRLWVKSSSAKGSSFCFTLPSAEEGGGEIDLIDVPKGRGRNAYPPSPPRLTHSS